MRYVTRLQWQARPPASITPLPANRVDTVFYHYTGADADEQSDHRNCPVRVRGIQRFHQDTRGWSDIAYSFVVCKHGYVYEGRGYGVMSAATLGHNHHSLAVCFLGDDSENRDDLTMAGRKAFVEITQHIVKWAKRPLLFKGHRDVVSTQCPGAEIYRYVTGPEFAHDVRDPSEALRQKTGYFAWEAWYDGRDEWKVYGQRNPSVRPNVPKVIPPQWWARRLLRLSRRS